MNFSFKEPDIPAHSLIRCKSQGFVMIKEYIDVSKAIRTADEQKGFYLSFVPFYAVIDISGRSVTMSMAEVFDKFPWFFNND